MFKGLRDRFKKVSEQLEDELEAQLDAELEAELAASLEARPEAADAPTPPADPGPAPSAPGSESSAQDDPEKPRPPAEEGAPEPAERSPDPPAPPATDAAEAAAPVAPAAQPARAPAEPQRVTGRKVLTEDEVAARLERELGDAVAVQKEIEQVAQATGKTRYSINEDVLDDILWELELGLLESDVAVPVIEAIKNDVRDQLLSMQVGGRSPAEVVEKVLRAAVRRVLDIGHFDFDAFVRERLDAGHKPVVVMFVGVNGTGKTTSIARMAHRLKGQGVSCVLAAGDTFRAGAIEQLSQHADKLGVKIIKHSAGADPAAVAYDAIEHAKARHKDVVLLDTAGRMQTNTNLMDEMDKIRRVAKPDLTVFVGDSLAGNDAVEQARRFDDVVDVQGAILTKTDVDAKGGAALSVAYTINKPLLFIGVGQGYADLEPFDADVMVARLFGEE